MSSYLLSIGAKAALTDIYVYTAETWGTEQADRYLEGFFERLDGIAGHKVLWRPIPVEFEVEGFFTRYGKHLIYWKQVEDGNIAVVAILHASMLLSERLRAAFGEQSAED